MCGFLLLFIAFRRKWIPSAGSAQRAETNRLDCKMNEAVGKKNTHGPPGKQIWSTNWISEWDWLRCTYTLCICLLPSLQKKVSYSWLSLCYAVHHNGLFYCHSASSFFPPIHFWHPLNSRGGETCKLLPRHFAVWTEQGLCYFISSLNL